MHYGEGEDKDAQNSRLINDILDQEKPDLVVITGDVVSGYAWDKQTKPWTSIYYDKLA